MLNSQVSPFPSYRISKFPNFQISLFPNLQIIQISKDRSGKKMKLKRFIRFKRFLKTNIKHGKHGIHGIPCRSMRQVIFWYFKMNRKMVKKPSRIEKNTGAAARYSSEIGQAKDQHVSLERIQQWLKWLPWKFLANFNFKFFSFRVKLILFYSLCSTTAL